MDHLGDKSFNLDSPSKQSYVGSFYQPPETLSRRLYMNTITEQLDRKSSGVQDISPQLYQRVPDAGSRAVISALKTLQEKMRRLELERVQAERNIQQFSQATRHRADASAQREPENSTRENHSTQRNGLVSKLQSAEKRCSQLEKQLDYMRKMVEGVEKDRITCTDRQESLCKESKHTDPQMQVQLNKLERLENEYLKLTNTQSVAERKIELLEQKLLEEEHERKLVQEKAEELQRELENNLLTLSAVTQPKGKKKKGKASCKKVETAHAPKAKHLPFVAGTSTSPSHSVNANVQSVLHMMKHRNPRLCERMSALRKSGSENQRVHRRPPSSPSKETSTMGSLSELLLALQDELGQMSFEHQELVKQIDETIQRELRDDLERELDCLVKRMEEKAAQITQLRKHQQTGANVSVHWNDYVRETALKMADSLISALTMHPLSHRQVQKLSQPSCSPKQKQQKPHRTASIEGKTRAQSGVQPLPPSPVKASPSTGQKQSSHESLKLLRETQKLCSSLRRQDITWET